MGLGRENWWAVASRVVLIGTLASIATRQATDGPPDQGLLVPPYEDFADASAKKSLRSIGPGDAVQV